jgi:spermidine/putrescine transport system substrate-binding protein
MVPETEENLGSWALMWDSDYRGDVLQFRNPRDAFATAQFYLGLEINSTNPVFWRSALESLIEQKRNTNTAYVMDEVFSKMQSGSAAIAPYYAGDFFTMYAENEDLAFFYPEEGVNIYVDAMCVPKASKNPDLAKEYINFMLSEEIAIANAEYICYASPNTLVQQNADYQAYMTEEVHPEAMKYLYEFDRDTTEYYHNLPTETLSEMNVLWEELMIAGSPGKSIYILCAISAGVLAVVAVWYCLRRKKRASYY